MPSILPCLSPRYYFLSTNLIPIARIFNAASSYISVSSLVTWFQFKTHIMMYSTSSLKYVTLLQVTKRLQIGIAAAFRFQSLISHYHIVFRVSKLNSQVFAYTSQCFIQFRRHDVPFRELHAYYLVRATLPSPFLKIESINSDRACKRKLTIYLHHTIKQEAIETVHHNHGTNAKADTHTKKKNLLR